MKANSTLRDPVCGRKVNRNKAHIVITVNGEEYVLCCPKCQSEFEKNPERYLRRERP
ncbi:MAG: Copper-transporting P-type ATPase [Calditrichaeota bacterium]|nr:Copper-transporting P-type ATPase [Calditrichota bacterium]